MTRNRLSNQRFEKLRFEFQINMKRWQENPREAQESASDMKQLTEIVLKGIREELAQYSTLPEFPDLQERVNWAEKYLCARCNELVDFSSFDALSPEGKAFFGMGEDKEYQEKTEPVDLPPFTFRFENMRAEP